MLRQTRSLLVLSLRHFVLAVTTMVLMAGCAGRDRTTVAERDQASVNAKVRCDAYLFDSRLYREGKPTTVRLEVFVTDSVVGIGGRAYLGKGAVKGRLTEDTVKLYFPSSDEYVYEAVDDVITSSECPFSLNQLNIIELFHARPDSLDWGELSIDPDYQDEDRPSFVIYRDGCEWQIELTYDFQKDRWRIRDFNFSDGGTFTLKGDRRQVKAGATVEANKFKVTIPHNAVRTRP
jgi:hypothetical protein